MVNLFEQVVETQLLHPNFVALMSSDYADVRAVLNSWAEGFVDRDNDFESKFQTQFNPQFWELYLHQVFKESGFNPSYEKAAPDYALRINDHECVVEATTTQAANGTTPEWLRNITDFRPGHNDVMFHYATVRFANAFSAKLKKYRDSYAKLEHVAGKPFIVGIGQYEQPLFFLCGHIPALRVLFGLDEPLYVWNGNEIMIVGSASRSVELKRFDAPIRLGLFRDDSAKEISGVLCSALATTGKCQALSGALDPGMFFFAVRFDENGDSVTTGGAKGEYKESLADGLHLFVNPFAENALDPQPFMDAGIAVHILTEDPPAYEFIAPKGTLSTRTTISIRQGKGTRKKLLIEAQPLFPDVVQWPEGELVEQESSTILSDREYLAHYKGWTIHVARDRTEQDWYGQGVERLVTSTSGVIEANRYIVRSVGPIASHPTKESALRKIADLIDECDA